MKATRTIVGIGLAVLIMAATGSLASQERSLWLRYPAISPDGSTLVFAYRGDLYRVPVEGGLAAPLTIYEGTDFMPVWSPDGREIAFASDRSGNLDVWIMPAEGGRARRLTFHSANDRPWSFTPDSGQVVYSSSRLDAATSALFPWLPELYSVPTSGGRERQILTTPAEYVHFDGAGDRFLFQDLKGVEDEWRKHHTSSVARDIWIHDLRDGSFSQLTREAAEDRNPVFTPDEASIVFLSERDGTMNVYRASLDDPDQAEALTSFDTHPVRFLTSSDDGLLAFSWDGEIYTLRPGAEPSRIPIEIRSDLPSRPERTLTVTSGATEMALSPSEKEVAFVYRGEVFATSLETNVTKQVTRTPEQERSISFSPDGRSILYAGERNGSWNLYRTNLREGERYFFTSTVLDEVPVLVTDQETFQPTFSPDGKEVAYLENRETLKVLNLESQETRTLLPGSATFSYSDGDQYYQWSPDGKWFLVQYLLPGYWSPEVGLARADGTGEIVNLTESGFVDIAPKWAAGGSMMIWRSNRDGLRSAAGSGSSQGDIYGLFFTQEAFDRFRLSKEEFALLQEAEKEAKKKEGDEGEKEDEDEDEEKEIEPIVLELDGIQDRTARLTIHSSSLSDSVITPDSSTLLYLARFEKGYDLWSTDLRTRETKILLKLGGERGGLVLDKEGENVFVLSDGRISKIEVGSGKRTPITFSGEMVLDPVAEREYMFEHVWRQVREKFYTPDLHGAPWDLLKTEYARYLPHISNNRDFAEMLSELLGELNASHTGGSYRHSASDGDVTGALGVFFDESWEEDGMRIAEVLRDGPLDKAESRASAGTILVAVNGDGLTSSTNYARVMNRSAGKNIRLSFRDPTSDETWDETVKPISSGAEGQLAYERWVEQRRILTDSLSDGRIGYVHVRNMDDPSYRTVLEEVLGKQVTKDAIIIDTRFNGGGDLVDDMSVFLTGRRYQAFIAPDGQLVGVESQRRWTKPSAMLVAEGNYSDAHCVPHMYQYLEIGPVIGMPVPGTCTFVWWERLQDSSLVFGIPNMGVTDGVGGQVLENYQLEPDILIRNEWDLVAQGRDQQLERAVQELLRTLNGGR